jgi:hypothetical protein
MLGRGYRLSLKAEEHGKERSMTVGKATALTAAFIGVFAVGVAVGPSVKDVVSDRHPGAQAEQTQKVTTPPPAADQTAARAPARSTSRARSTASNNSAAVPAVTRTTAMPASEPRLHAQLKPVLNPGARMAVAAEGFRSAEEFAAVAHAARNTSVPFMVLKHRVVDEGRTLEAALRDVKPDVDAKAEVARAQAAAKSDVAAIAG